MKNCIFGYGSLISEESRKRTGISGEAFPVTVEGIERGWFSVVPSYGMTAVGAKQSFGKNECNGVIFEVPEGEMPKFDEREIPHGYSRIEIPRSNIESITKTEIPEGKIWTYVSKYPGVPTEAHPIVQSYVDVIISGCFEYGEQFARNFIQETQGWDNPWINDRSNPRYIRAMERSSFEDQVEDMFKKMIPIEFSKRRYFEGE